MSSPQVDLVLVLDASASMAPCFKALCAHLKAVLMPLQGHVATVNFGLLAQSVGKRGKSHVVRFSFLGGESDVLDELYRHGPGEQIGRDHFFTTDAQRVVSRMEEVEVSGDEDMLIALDTAADFPFGPLATTKRVIALFSDEKFETGAFGRETAGQLPALMQKIQARHIQLFAAVPEGKIAEELSAVDRSEVEFVRGGDGLAAVDFGQLLRQMGKSISASVTQMGKEADYEKGLFGQAQWGRSAGEFSADNLGWRQ